MKQGTALKYETAVLGTVNLGAGEVGRQQVRGELDAVKIALDTITERLDRACLGEPGRAFDEQVTIGQNCDQETLYEPLLADDAGAQGLF